MSSKGKPNNSKRKVAAPRNSDRFGSWEEAYLAWMRETQDFDDWGELDGDTHDDAEELWMHWSADDQNREFCDWLFAPAEEGGRQ